eukprot:3021506-Prymnesium_polylepis.1
MHARVRGMHAGGGCGRMHARTVSLAAVALAELDTSRVYVPPPYETPTKLRGWRTIGTVCELTRTAPGVYAAGHDTPADETPVHATAAYTLR